MIDIRDNWRILMLVVVCLIGALALFGPLGADADTKGVNATEQITDPTNLQYGLDLSGGTRIRGQLVGQTAEEIDISDTEPRTIEETVATELGLEPIDVSVRRRGGDLADIEIFARTDNVTTAEFLSALQAANLDASESDIRRGVTSETRDTAVDTLESRIDETGLSGASVTTISAATGGNFIVAEVPGADQESIRELIGDPGQVQIIAGYPTQTANGTELVTEEVLTQDDISGIQRANAEQGEPRVPVTLNQEGAERFANVMRDGGFTNEGAGRCAFEAEEHDGPVEGEWCLYTVVDGEYVAGHSMGTDLAQTINSGDFVKAPNFVMLTSSLEEAEQLEVNLRAGALPTNLDIQSENYISPSLAQKFKPLALMIGIAAWLTVSVVVYFWYRDVRIAIPMVLTATSEVFLLLGFAAAVGLALDLSHIAGLIAVIGTGLDDLLIMADEILQRKQEVQTGRVFQSRFRKAFWVIGMAAATTIIAMSPLAVLSLGDLQGFAIITIVGVLIGVGITRPAYGDVLRHLMLDDVKRS
jgi:preprotein translocase subunit SecD